MCRKLGIVALIVAALVAVIAALATFAFSNPGVCSSHSYCPIKVEQKMPDAGFTLISKKKSNPACNTVDEIVFTACNQGYAVSGGSKDKASEEYKFGTAACNSASDAAHAACEGGLIQSFKGKTGKGHCADLATFVGTSILIGCDEYEKEYSAELFAKCVNDWAPKGAEDFESWCNGKMKEEPEESDPVFEPAKEQNAIHL